MREQWLDISLQTNEITWEDIFVPPMKIHGSLTDREVVHDLMLSSNEHTDQGRHVIR